MVVAGLKVVYDIGVVFQRGVVGVGVGLPVGQDAVCICLCLAMCDGLCRVGVG